MYHTYCHRRWERQGYRMDNKHNIHKGKYGSNVLLLVVLIGFCILAIIEILYGQAQIRMERERLAMEEDNHQAVQELKEEGLMGIEAIYSTYTSADERQIRTLAAKYGLFISGGSDFHGANKPGLDLGTGYGKLYVPCSLLQSIRKALE